MRLTQIEVECYAAAKADETPRRFNLEGQTIEVNEVLDRWYQVESKPECGSGRPDAPFSFPSCP